MNRAIIRRWINEYLDGEIGLADKAELELIMAENPEVRQEYRELRRLSLYLSGMPEGTVHSSRFRQRVFNSLDAQENTFFTPQRAFAGAMLVAMLVVAITFGLMLYNQVMQPGMVVSADDVIVASELAYSLDLEVDTTAEAFFNRLLLETEIGMVDNSLLQPFLTSTGVFEGAVCSQKGGLNPVRFPRQLPATVRVKVTPRQALTLSKTAEGLSGRPADLAAFDSNGVAIDFKDFIQYNGGDNSVYLKLNFR